MRIRIVATNETPFIALVSHRRLAEKKLFLRSTCWRSRMVSGGLAERCSECQKRHFYNGARFSLTCDSLAVCRDTCVKFAVRLAADTPGQAQYAFPVSTIDKNQVMTTINTPRFMISRAAAVVCLPPRSVCLDAGRPKCRPWSHQTHAVRTRISSPPSTPCTLRSILSPISRGSCMNRNHSSGGLDYGSLMAAPGTALHNDIMESAARRQTG